MERAAALEEKQNRELERRCAADPLWWMQHATKTRDDHWKTKGRKPFDYLPDLPYFPRLFEILRQERRLFLPKSREMMLSWAVIGYGVHFCQWNQNTHVIVQSERAAKSIVLVSGKDLPGYARTLYDQQEPYLKLRHLLTKPSSEMAGDFLTWKNGSSVQAVPGAADQVRQYHPALLIMDEAAFMTEAAASYETAHPVASQIIVISSAGPGWFADHCLSLLGL
jgi:hypothetical protein